MNISAVIPAYNAELYIKKSIMSLIQQTVPVQEIIIIDDGSTDKTIENINELQKKYNQIKLFTQKNSGASAARNNGISKAKGEWILFLDADDECDCTLVENYIEQLKYNEYTAAMYCAFMQINELGQPITEPFEGFQLNGEEGFCKMLLRNPIISPSGSLVRKSVLLDLKRFDVTIKYVEDVDFWLRLLLSGQSIGYLPKPLSLIRRHIGNTTVSMESTRQGELVLLNKFGLDLIEEIIYRRSGSIENNHFDYIQFLIRFNKWKEAKNMIDSIEFPSSSNNYVSYLFIRSIIELHYSDYKAARDTYSLIVELQPNHGAALNNLGAILALDGELEMAKHLFQRALQCFPGYLDANYNIEQMGQINVEYRFTKRELRKNLLRYS